jgi:uncharacterized protein
MTTRAQIDRFLAGHRIGFAGLSTDPADFSRTIFRELEARGYDIVPIHPTAAEIAGRTAYANVYDVPGKLDGVLIMTPRSATAGIVAQCMTASVPRVWMHRGVGAGAVDHHVATYARSRGLDVIEGECPMMFLSPTAAIHQAHAAVRHAFGHYPDDVARDRLAPLFAIAYGVIAWSVTTLVATATGSPWAHALAAPLVFAGAAWLHARRPGNLPVVRAALVFLVVSLALDISVIAVLAGRAFSVVPSLLGFIGALYAFASAPASARTRSATRSGAPAA